MGTSDVLAAVKASGVRYELVRGWDDTRIDPYRSGFKPCGVVLHHTANGGAKGNAPSLNYIVRNTYYPVRACHFLIGRDGTVYVVAGNGAYHAGVGGPLDVAGVKVAKDAGNRHFYGIEIESKGTKAHTDADETDADGMTPAQVEATAKLTAALCRMLGKDESAVIRHRDWAPGRKVDVLQPLEFWRAQVAAQLTPVEAEKAPEPAPSKPRPNRRPRPKPPVPVVTVSNVQPGDEGRDVLIVQRALAAEVGLDFSTGPGVFGPRTTAAYRKWQRACGVRANGNPDAVSLAALGAKHGFEVRAA